MYRASGHYPGTVTLVQSKTFDFFLCLSDTSEVTLILAFEANSALSRENETKLVKITHSATYIKEMGKKITICKYCLCRLTSEGLMLLIRCRKNKYLHIFILRT